MLTKPLSGVFLNNGYGCINAGKHSLPRKKKNPAQCRFRGISGNSQFSNYGGLLMSKTIQLTLFMMFAVLLVWGCSEEEKTIVEKTETKIDQVTTKAADTAVKKIRSPIDKAKLSKTIGNDRMEKIDKTLSNQ